MRLPSTITVRFADWQRSGPMLITVRYSAPLRARLWLAIQLTRLVAWLVSGTADVAREDVTP